MELLNLFPPEDPEQWLLWGIDEHGFIIVADIQ